jgi:hypothetical protein
MMTRDRLAAVHMAKKALKLGDEEYGWMLEPFGVTSSKDLTTEQFQTLMSSFERLGYKNPDQGHSKPKARKNSGLIDAATESQIGYIYHLWETAPTVKNKTEEALLNFVKRMAMTDDWKSITRIDASHIITAITKL